MDETVSPDVRSDGDLDEEPVADSHRESLEWEFPPDVHRDLLIWEFTSSLYEKPEPSLGLKDSLRTIFSWRNYTVYLATAWMFNASAAIWGFFNLYLRSLDWDYVVIGAVFSLTGVVSALARILGGYVGDVYDRKKLAVVAMFMVAIYHIIIGLFIDFILIFVGLMILATMDIAKSGSSAYIMDNIPREHSGFGLSLFTAGRIFGVITLAVFGALVPLIGFRPALRQIYLITGVMLLFCTAARLYILEPNPQKGRGEGNILKEFLSDNMATTRILVSMLPGVLMIVLIDAISDSIFKFGAIIYTNEILEVPIFGITIILMATILISVPLLLKVGRISDKWGVKKAALVVYTLMPICAFLLIIAPIFPFWVPQSLVDATNSVLDGLGVVFSTAFLGIVVKYVNDALWYLILLTLIQKKMPRENTAKILAHFWFVVYLCASVGPLLGGLIYQFQPSYLFTIVLIFNLLILAAIARFGVENNENRNV